MEDKLNQNQHEAVYYAGGPLLMAAGAGSGKTKALTSRLKALVERGIKPEEIVAITFTNKAAEEMRERVFPAGGGSAFGGGTKKPNGSALITPGLPFIGTFHSFGARILKQEAAKLGRSAGFSIFDDDDSQSLIKKIIKEMDLPKEQFRAPVLLSKISDVKSELGDPKNFFNSEDDYERIVASLFTRYEAELLKNNAFDFDDLIEKPVRLFQSHPELLASYQRLFTHILVDEYQDINTTQYQLVRLLAQKHNNVSVVGDDAQAIYSFRGADFRNFLNFERDWPNAKIVKLEQNYRSSGNIIAAASAVIKQNKLQKPKELWTENPDGELIKMVSCEDPETESVWVANEIRAIREKDPSVTIAIMYRTNAQSRPLEQALISENLPYTIFGGLKFYQRKEIKDLVAALRVAANPADDVGRERVEKALGKRLAAILLAKLPEVKDLPPVELISFFMQAANYKEYLEQKFNNPAERMENIAELINFASQFSTLQEFLERILLLQSSDVPSEKRTGVGRAARLAPITLMTIHVAKGLEFDYVFIAGVNEGMLPHEKSMLRVEDVEEERRLMYVAMTRAKKVLYILFHSFPSRFLYEVPRELLQFISPSGLMDALPDEDEMWIEN